MNLCCQICSTFYSRSIFEMLQHLLKVHRNDSTFHVSCDVLGCNSTFVKVNSYKSHLIRKHADVNLKASIAVEDVLREPVAEAEPDADTHAANCQYADGEKGDPGATHEKHASAIFILKIKEHNLLTQKSVDNIVENSTELVKNNVQRVRDSVDKCLNDAGVNFNAVPGLGDIFSERNPISKPFLQVSTRSRQCAYFKKHFGFVEPKRIVLGHRSKRRRCGIKYQSVVTDDEVLYVPLLKSLEQMLNQDCILAEVQKCHARQNTIGMIEDVCDGQLFRHHPLFSKDPTAIQLMIYYDEVEIANPLGSKTGKHKLCVVYYTLGNISPTLRSKLQAVQLLLITTSPVIKDYGIDEILQPFMDELQHLEQDGGHQFLIKGKPVCFTGTIVLVSGDNLGSQLVGGFKEGSGARLKCRHCLGNSDEIQQMFYEKNFILRTMAGHDKQCKSIEQNEDLSKVYGVCRRSILCNSKYYHVVDGMPGDAMHDVLEGVLQYGCKEMLKAFMYEDKYFSLDELNKRLQDFDYGYYNDSNKPSPINRLTMKNGSNSLRQKAAQMWCFGKFLPLVIGNVVPEEDEKWQHYMLLLKIVDYVFLPSFPVDYLSVLEGLIHEYLWNFTKIYPGRSITPKMHYLVHYPAHMYKFGPMVRTWCMRYEAKHNYFKRIAAHMGNFINVAFTLGERHQTQMCYHMNGHPGNEFLPSKASVGSGMQKVAGDVGYFDLLKQKDGGLESTDTIQEVQHVKIYGTEYRVGAVVRTGSIDELSQFASIEHIVV